MFYGCDTVITWNYDDWKRKWLDIIKKHNLTHKQHADIIKSCGAHGAMHSGAEGFHIGCVPRKILFYIWRHKFFPQETQLQKGSSRVPGKIFYSKNWLFFLSCIFPVILFVLVKKKNIKKNQKLPVTFFAQKTQLDKGHIRIPRKNLYKIDYLFALSYFFHKKFKIYWTKYYISFYRPDEAVRAVSFGVSGGLCLGVGRLEYKLVLI